MAKKKTQTSKRLKPEEMEALYKTLRTLSKEVAVRTTGFKSAGNRSWIWNIDEQQALNVVLGAVRDCF